MHRDAPSDADILSEPPLGLAQLARAVGVHPQTLGRWCRQGLSGVKLESYRRGGRRVSTLPALHRFFARLSATEASIAELNENRATAVARAEAELTRQGL